MHDAFLPRKKKLKPLSTSLRKNMTAEEKHLWYDFLSTYPVRFNRQRIILHYIVDFYCDRAKLVIELDGEQHALGNAPEYDAARTAELEKLGLYVLRISNYELKKNFHGVCASIDEWVQNRLLFFQK